ncbi:hypothetical protein VNO77_25079 [Canavalia gladiata]|uniref:Secreted protein n=1 Tax=Canavalia gladiata TaxID=3824 RepID=A0AAN9QGU4_CANGL
MNFLHMKISSFMISCLRLGAFLLKFRQPVVPSLQIYFVQTTRAISCRNYKAVGTYFEDVFLFLINLKVRIPSCSRPFFRFDPKSNTAGEVGSVSVILV